MRHLSLDPRCPRCFMKPALCLCAALLRRPTRHHVRVIVHEIELQKSTNSGRLLPLLLQNAELVPYGNPDSPLPSSPWPESTRPVVIFPLEGAPLLPDLVGVDDGDPRPWTLLMLDGTWHQANRLRKRFLLAHVPFARLPVDGRPSTYQLRQSQFSGSLSTLEAAARALSILEGPGDDVEAHLLDGFRRMVDRTLWLRGSKDGADVYGGLPAGITRHGINQPPSTPTAISAAAIKAGA